MAGERVRRREGRPFRLDPAGEQEQDRRFGLGAVLLGVLLPVSFGVPSPELPFGRHGDEVRLAIVLTALFATALVAIAGRVGRRSSDWWFACAGLGLIVAHPAIDSVDAFSASWTRPARLILGAVFVALLTGLIAARSWGSKLLRVGAVGLSLVCIATALLSLGGGPQAGALGDAAALALSWAAVGIGGVAFIYGQREPDGTLTYVGMSALAVGFGQLLLLTSGGSDLTVGVAIFTVVAAVAALAAGVMALFEALARREMRREALIISNRLSLARLEAQALRFDELAHDQRSTLLAIEAAAKQMRERPSGELAAAVAAEAARLNRLLGEPERGAQHFELRDAIAPLVECMRAFDSNIAITGGPVTVWADVDEVVEIIGALVDNALTHGRSPICVEISPPGHAPPSVRVVDNGSGVPEPLRVSVFDRGVSTSPADHSGLGLYSARRMAAAMHGSLTIAGDHDSAFVLTLPADSPADAPAPMAVDDRAAGD